MRSSIVAIALVIFISTKFAVAVENWPQWRGPLGTGVAADGEFPAEFSNTDGVTWKIDLPGKGSSTPAVWGDRIFVTCAIGDSPEAIGFKPGKMADSTAKDGLVCYDMNGKELWRKELGTETPGKHPNGSGSNPSPVTDGKHVVVYFKSGTLACFDFDGKQLWKTNLPERFGKNTLWWDLGTSPVIANNSVIVAVEQSPKGQGGRYGGAAGEEKKEDSRSYLAAFDLATGDLKWQQFREYECAEESDQSYSTPQIVKSDGKDAVVTWGADHLTAHDVATGKLLWESGNFNPKNERAWRTIASTTISDGVAIVPYGRGKFLAGVRVGGSGDVSEANRLWQKMDVAGDIPTPVVSEGKAYLLGDTGKLTCVDVKTGEVLWSASLPKHRNKYFASPVLAGNKLYCTREDGTIFVGEVSDTGFKQLAANEMGEHVIATPIPIRGGLLVRGEERLYWIGPNRVAAQ